MKLTITKLKSASLKTNLNLKEMESIKGGKSRPMKRRKLVRIRWS